MISIDRVSKFYGKQDLLKEISCSINPGDKIALVGVNGTGKTTLLKIILGRVDPDEGQVHTKKGLRIGYLPQEIIQIRGKSVIQMVMEMDADLRRVQSDYREITGRLSHSEDPEEQVALALRQSHLLEELERLGGYDLEARAKQVLAGLGFSEDQFSVPVETLSGGWIMRAALARLLLMKPDLLLLDEPTNHLDLDSLLWLEHFLQGTPSALLLISHDRIFLDRVVRKVFELEKGLLTIYNGNYTFYQEEKIKRLHFQEAAYFNQMEKIRQMEDFIARNRSRKDRARQVQSRLKTLDRLERLEHPLEEHKIAFQFSEPVRSGRVVLELVNVAKTMGKKPLYQGVNLTVTRGECLAILGPNGAGKSTLMKIMIGAIRPDQGERRVGHQVSIGYFSQNQLDQLTGDNTVWQEIAGVAGDRTYGNLRNQLAAFLFRDEEEIKKKVSVLSGGEKSRLVILKMLLGGANFLLFDEPTNHLDIPSRDILEEALRSFNGTLCLITHDRHLIDALAHKVIYLKEGRLEIFPGNYRDFEQVWKGRLEGETDTDEGDRESLLRGLPRGRKSQREKRREADRRNALFRLKAPLQKEIEEMELRLSGIYAEKEDIEKTLADPEFYRRGVHVQETHQRYGLLQKEIEDLTLRWEGAMRRLEEVEYTEVDVSDSG